MRAVGFVTLMIVVATSGCLGGDDGGSTASPSGSPDGGNVTAPTFTVAIQDAPQNITLGAAANISWSVDAGTDASGNATKANVTTSFRWGNESIAQADLTAESYENETGLEENAQIPATFNASFTPEANGTVYGRAVVIYGSGNNTTLAWSAEVMIEVESAAPTGPTSVTTVDIVGAGFAATYDPHSVTIKVGEGVKWDSMDPAVGHTASSDAGAPAAFSVPVPANGESEVVLFTVPGTYNYHCNVHATMTGQLGGVIIVQ